MNPITLQVSIRDWKSIPSSDWLLIQDAWKLLTQVVKTNSSDYTIGSDKSGT